jgi:hypothetical protein
MLFTAIVPLICGAGVTLGCGGAPFTKRILAASVCGLMVAICYTVTSTIIGYDTHIEIIEIAISLAWRVFILTLLSTIGAFLTVLKLPEPDLD